MKASDVSEMEDSGDYVVVLELYTPIYGFIGGLS